MEPLPVSGSARRYYRVFTEDRTYVGVYHENLRENRLFVDFTRHFEKSRLHVPHVYCVSEDGFCYLQDDLGPDMLLDVVAVTMSRNKMDAIYSSYGDWVKTPGRETDI